MADVYDNYMLSYAYQFSMPPMYCYYNTPTVPYFRFREEQLSWDPMVVAVYDVVTDTQAEDLRQVVLNRVRTYGRRLNWCPHTEQAEVPQRARTY